MRIAVVGSVNLDLVASVATLPAPGETVTNATLARHPGGKGANQALAARRLGADVTLVACLGDDGHATEALRLLRAAGVELQHCVTDATLPTGVALIAVAAGGENQIVVAPGANRALQPEHLPDLDFDALIVQLEIPAATVLAAATRARGWVTVNLAPASAVEPALLRRADLIVVNETEAQFYGAALQHLPGLVALTLGARGAQLLRAGEVIAQAAPPAVQVVDTTGAGDCFVAALTLALLEQQPAEHALRFACAAGAVAATRSGAQPSMPERDEVQRLVGTE